MSSRPIDKIGFSAETTGCQECRILREEMGKNPGGKPMNNKGLALALTAGKSNKSAN